MPYIDTEVNELLINRLSEEELNQLKNNNQLQNNQIYITPDEGRVINSLPIGTIISSTLVQDDSSLHLLDGSSLLINGIYSQFAEWLINKKTSNSSSVPTCTIEEYASDMNNYQQCGKFVINNTSNALTSNGYSVNANSIKLPTITRIIQATTESNNLGKSIEAGLPNITGSVKDNGQGGAFVVSGAFSSTTKPSMSYYVNSGGQTFGFPTLKFDASKSNSIYGKSNTVQPITVQYYYYIVVATVTKTNIEVDIDNVATNINNIEAKLDKTEQVELVYEAGSSNPDINLGYTNGIIIYSRDVTIPKIVNYKRLYLLISWNNHTSNWFPGGNFLTFDLTHSPGDAQYVLVHDNRASDSCDSDYDTNTVLQIKLRIPINNKQLIGIKGYKYKNNSNKIELTSSNNMIGFRILKIYGVK